MFNTYVDRRSSGPSHVTVTEKRAPTDESVRLLKEMEDAAKAKITEALVLEDNEFHGVIHMERDVMSDTMRAAASFDINGHRMTTQFTLPAYKADRVEMLKGLRDEMAKKIASEILVELVREIPL